MPPDRTCSPICPLRSASIRSFEPATRPLTAGCSPQASLPGRSSPWEYHYGVYWDLTQRLYREEFDPSYDGALDAGIPFCPSGTPFCDADYDYADAATAHNAMRKVQLTGNLRRPMVTLHGTLDALLPIATDSDVYHRLIKRQATATCTATTESRAERTSTASTASSATESDRSSPAPAPPSPS